MPNCSLRKRILYVLLALMLLPVVSAFAQSNTFPITVTSMVGPVDGAKVYVWDKNSEYNGWIWNSGITDSSGIVKVVLPGLTPTTNSLANPAPNVGILVLPDNKTNGTSLAFAVTETLFYNFMGVDASAQNTMVMLDKGCLVTVAPEKIDFSTEPDTVVSGLATTVQLNIPGVPSRVFVHNISVSDLSAQNTWQTVWPFASQMVFNFNQVDYYDETKPEYYSWETSSFAVADAATIGEPAVLTVKPQHSMLKKGKFSLNTGTTDTIFTLSWMSSGNYNFQYANNRGFTGLAEIYLPFGNYNFKFTPLVETDTQEIQPAIEVFPNVEISDSPVSKAVVVAGGSALSGQIALANAGNLNALDELHIVLQKQVDFGGFEQWLEIETVYASSTYNLSTWETLYNGAYNFKHRVLTGESHKYRVITKHQSEAYPGIIDDISAPKRCYSNHESPVFYIPAGVAEHVYDFSLDQAAAVLVNVSIINGTTNGGYPNTPKVAVLPNAENNYGYQISSEWDPYNNELFVPFVDVTRQILARVDYDEDTLTSGNAICQKVSAPITPEAGKTLVTSLEIDPTKFQLVSANLSTGPTEPVSPPMPPAAFPFVAYAHSTPLIDLNGKTWMVAEIMGDYIENSYGFEYKAFTPNDPQPFQFKAELGKTYRLKVTEQKPAEGEKPLAGILPFSQDFTIDAVDAANPKTIAMVVDEGRSFFGKVLEDSVPVAGQMIGVRLSSIYDPESGYSDQIVRQQSIGLSPDGTFRVAGIPAGRYAINLILDMIDPNKPVYNVQSMPFINREVYVDENASTKLMSPTTIQFNLDSKAIGYLKGMVTDESGSPVEGALVEVCKSSADGNNYYSPNSALFYCTTNAAGAMITPSSDKIPLENGNYAIYIVGLASKPTGFSYQFANYGSKPFATVQVYANNLVSTARVTLQRKFPVEGTINENAAPVSFANIQISDMNGQQIDYAMTDKDGKFNVYNGLVAGDYLFGIHSEGGRRFYQQKVTVTSSAATNVLTLALDPTTLKTVKVRTVDSNGVTLPEANGSIIVFSDSKLLFRADHNYLTWVQSDAEGNIELSLPPLTGSQAAWVYAFQGHPKFIESNNVFKTYVAPDITLLNLDSTTPQVLTWMAPINVTVEAQVPAGSEGKYIGVLMQNSAFLAGPVLDNEGPDGPMPGTDQGYEPGHGEQRTQFYAAYADGKFVFENVLPNQDYVFMAYEAFSLVSPEMMRWADYFPYPALFRYLSAPFKTAAVDLTQQYAFWRLADLNLTCPQDASIPSSEMVRAFFTPNSVSTTGNVGWPVLAGDPGMNLAYPVKLPASYSYRIAFAPASTTGMLGKVWEDTMLPSNGRTLEMALSVLPKLSGFCTIGDPKHPIEGNLVLIPKGVDATDSNFQPIRFKIENGNYTGYLKPGFYHGYVVPMAGYAKYIELEMGSQAQTFNVDLLNNGHPIRGTVTMAGEAGVAMPLVGASVRVMRKQAKVSSLTDGQPMYPYLAMMGQNEIPCGPMGEFFFPAEVGVDYYVQAIVPAGFKPGAPVRVSGAESKPQVEQLVNIVVGSGASISGFVTAPCHIEAIPVGGGSSSDFGSSNAFFADSYYPDPNDPTKYPFTIVGLDEAMAYDITFTPTDGMHSYKKMTGIVPPVSNLEVKLSEGFKITGQLVDPSGEPLNAANVQVNLAMSLMMTKLTLQSGDGIVTSVQPRQSVRAQEVITPSPLDYGLDNTMMNGMWAMTDQYGRFTFNNVPEFLTAFIRVENGFSVDGISYGRTRTADFASAFVSGTTETMHFDVKVPMAGRIIGRLIDDTAKPINYAGIDAILGNEYNWGNADEQGRFIIDGLAPGANYMVHVMDMPGFTSVFRSGILVEPGKTTDLGTLVVSRAIYAYGMVSGSLEITRRAFPYGVSEKEGVGIVAVDGTRAITDEDLLSGNYQQAMLGDAELCLDSTTDELGFSMQLKAGKTHIAAFLWRESEYGFDTLVSWGWKTGIVVPTQEQLGSGAFQITADNEPIKFPQKFGDIGGSLKHSNDAAVVFNPSDAVIVLLPAVASGTSYVLGQAPFPVAVTRVINGKWLIKDVPQGNYYIKAVTSRYGALLPSLITIGDSAITKDLLIGTAVKKLTGQVVLTDGTTPVSSAKVNLVLKGISTSTDASGNFSFFLPVAEYFIPQIEISKPGIKTMRITEVKNGETVVVASAGASLTDPTTNLDLGKFVVSNSVGSVEVTVTSSKDKKIYIGAEVAMVFQEDPTKPVWTVGELQTTNEAGVARFQSVPTGKAITFRARAHYHAPALKVLEAAQNTGSALFDIEMPVLLPKVFYTGNLTPIEGDESNLTLKASFDFNQVVVKDDVGLFIGVPGSTGATVDRRPSMPLSSFPDLIGTRITNMLFTGAVPNAGGLVASVTYNSTQIGSFSLLQTSMFRKEYEVDPLSADGFNGRQVDDSGNVLPTGISVPPGYLNPEVNSFELEVATPTPAMLSAELDGAEVGVKPEFDGPTFKFSFQSGSNLGASTKQEGLFSITMAYSKGTVVEPRWYDTQNNIWSKVGIIYPIDYDNPQDGYITFKVDHLTEFAVLKNVTDSSASKRGDLTGDGFCNMSDIAVYMAWFLKGGTTSKETVKLQAELLYPSGKPISVANLPSATADDFNSDGVCNMSDIAYYMAWFLKGGTSDTTAVNTQAKSLYGSLVGSVSNLPGANVSR